MIRERLSAFVYAFRLSRAAGLGLRASTRLAYSFWRRPK